jgi:hypothetical protein
VGAVHLAASFLRLKFSFREFYIQFPARTWRADPQSLIPKPTRAKSTCDKIRS